MSVIVSVLNGEKYLPRMFDYLNKQTYQDYDVIFVVSVKSEDRSLSMVQAFVAENSDRSVVLHRGSGKLGEAKNIGLDLAMGDAIWFLDVDDSPSLRYMEILASWMESTGADIVGCNFVYLNNHSDYKEPRRGSSIIVMTSEQALKRRLHGRFPVASWSMLYRLDTVRSNRIRFPDGISEDISFTTETIMCSDKVCYIRMPLYGYVHNQGSICNSPSCQLERGMSEIERYEYLDTKVDPGCPLARYLHRRFAVLRMESAGHMSYPDFKTYVRSDRFERNVWKGAGFRVHIEYAFERHLPHAYHIAISWFLAHIYYRGSYTFYMGPRFSIHPDVLNYNSRAKE